MASFINTNMASLNTQNNLTKSQAALNTSIQRLSSGMRVNSAKDDAAGMAIATRMDSMIRGQTVAMRNANDAISFSQTAEGALSKINDNLQRMRELAVQSANGSNGEEDRTLLNTEFAQLKDEVTRIQSNTKFNGLNIMGGSTASTFTFQIGDGTSTNDRIDVTIDPSTALTASVGSSVSINAGTTDATGTVGQSAARSAITGIDAAIKEVNIAQIKHGANQNRFQAVISTLQVSIENQTTARSRIMDTDYAAETATMARGQILQQAGMAMLAQANQLPNGVMALMKG
jgi:flagellin